MTKMEKEYEFLTKSKVGRVGYVLVSGIKRALTSPVDSYSWALEGITVPPSWLHISRTSTTSPGTPSPVFSSPTTLVRWYELRPSASVPIRKQARMCMSPSQTCSLWYTRMISLLVAGTYPEYRWTRRWRGPRYWSGICKGSWCR